MVTPRNGSYVSSVDAVLISRSSSSTVKMNEMCGVVQQGGAGVLRCSRTHVVNFLRGKVQVPFLWYISQLGDARSFVKSYSSRGVGHRRPVR